MGSMVHTPSLTDRTALIDLEDRLSFEKAFLEGMEEALGIKQSRIDRDTAMSDLRATKNLALKLKDDEHLLRKRIQELLEEKKKLQLRRMEIATLENNQRDIFVAADQTYSHMSAHGAEFTQTRVQLTNSLTKEIEKLKSQTGMEVASPNLMGSASDRHRSSTTPRAQSVVSFDSLSAAIPYSNVQVVRK